MNQLSLAKETRKASTQSVKFTDGMLVTAEDLSAAMHYPLGVLQVLVRSFFGCGIVCGLELDPGRRPQGTQQGQSGGYGQNGQAAASTGTTTHHQPNFILQVNPGVALDCDGFPIELCDSIKLDLTPDPCIVGPIANIVPFYLCIAIRRVTSDERPKPGCGCNGGSGGDSSKPQCSRVAEHVQVQAFDPENLPDGICQAQESTDDEERYEIERICDCLKTCRQCDRCGEGWVLLGCVHISKLGIIEVQPGGRQYVKPIECLCRTRGESAQTMDMMIGRMNRLEEKLAAMEPVERPTDTTETGLRQDVAVDPEAVALEATPPVQAGVPSAPPAAARVGKGAAEPRIKKKRKAAKPPSSPPPPPPSPDTSNAP